MVGIAREVGQQRLVDRLVVEVRVVVLFVRAVGETERDVGRGDPIAERGRRRAELGGERLVVSERGHRGVEGRERRLRAGRTGEALDQQPIGRVADRFGARGLDSGPADPLVVEHGVGRRVVGRPGIPHRGGHVVEVARVHGGPGKVVPDRVEQLLVPEAGHRPLLRNRAGAGRRRQRDHQEATHDPAAPRHSNSPRASRRETAPPISRCPRRSGKHRAPRGTVESRRRAGRSVASRGSCRFSAATRIAACRQRPRRRRRRRGRARSGLRMRVIAFRQWSSPTRPVAR